MKPANLLEALTDNIVVDKDKCIFCGKCVEHCILDNMRMGQAPCRSACPLDINIQGYVQLVARGRDAEARALIEQTLPFANIVCRICDHPCESMCHRRTVDGESVAINDIKRYLFASTGSSMGKTAAPSGQSVGIIGSGPAGLLAAHDLAVAGHAVSVYEAGPQAGGLLRTVIPTYKLPVQILDDSISALSGMGVRFNYNTRIHSAEDMTRLHAAHGAIIVATGYGPDRLLGLAHEDAPNVYHAMHLLAAIRQGENPALTGRVLIVGGGYAALDAAHVALRQGAETVTIVYRRTSADFKASPADIAKARQAGITFMFTWSPCAITTTDGQCCGIECRHDMACLPAACLDYPDFDPAEQRFIPAGHLIVAIGQDKDKSLAALCGQPANIDPVTMQLNETTVFVAGDVFTGPSSVVRAMAGGRTAAESVKRLFAGQHLRYERDYKGAIEQDITIAVDKALAIPRQQAVQTSCAGRGDYTEVAGTFTPEQARTEASRCLSCGGPMGRYRTCWFCLPCEVECPEKALWVDIPYLLR